MLHTSGDVKFAAARRHLGLQADVRGELSPEAKDAKRTVTTSHKDWLDPQHVRYSHCFTSVCFLHAANTQRSKHDFGLQPKGGHTDVGKEPHSGGELSHVEWQSPVVLVCLLRVTPRTLGCTFLPFGQCHSPTNWFALLMSGYNEIIEAAKARQKRCCLPWLGLFQRLGTV